MKSTDQWLAEYGESHQNHTNKLVHWVCVPLIMFSVIGLLWSIPSGYFSNFFPSAYADFINWGTIFLALALLFYLQLSFTLFVGMLLIAFLIVAGNYFLLQNATLPLWAISLIIFAFAWVGQFIGHKIEGKKPSFFKDLQFLLIGPAWLLSFIYRKVGIPY
jgi:uncharacterized membrane protein YGL010W